LELEKRKASFVVIAVIIDVFVVGAVGIIVMTRDAGEEAQRWVGARGQYAVDVYVYLGQVLLLLLLVMVTVLVMVGDGDGAGRALTSIDCTFLNCFGQRIPPLPYDPTQACPPTPPELHFSHPNSVASQRRRTPRLSRCSGRG
jgi:hypothetical protein